MTKVSEGRFVRFWLAGGYGEAERRSRCTYGGDSVAVVIFKQRDTLEGHDPGDGSPGRKGPKFVVGKHAWSEARKALWYIQGARTANRHR